MEFEVRTLVFNATFYPIHLCRALIQLGYEPYPYSYGRTVMFWKVVPLYPNIFVYAKNIYHQHGFVGLYTGFGYRLMHFYMSQFVCAAVRSKLLKMICSKSDTAADGDKFDEFDAAQADSVPVFLRRTLVINVSTVIAIGVSYPFQVLLTRTIAQLIGHESVYSSVDPIGSFSYVISREGAKALFRGVSAQMFGASLQVWFTNSIVFGIARGANLSKEYAGYVRALADLLISHVQYPLNLASFCMMINGCGLAAGQPPYMEIYSDWWDCCKRLVATGEHKRGSSLFGRAVPLDRIWGVKY